MSSRLRPNAAVFLCLVLLAACSSSGELSSRAEPGTQSLDAAAGEPGNSRPPGETDPPPAESERFDPQPISWRECGQGECGELTVPLHHDDPTGPTTELAVSRIPATGDPIGSLFVNFGGPGGEGTSTIMSFALLIPDEIRQNFHVVSWDPRGVDETSGLGCDSLIGDQPNETIDPSDGFAEDLERDEALFDRVMDCVAEKSIAEDLSTVAVADDLDLMRRAVGDERLNYLGFSYGTEIGWVYGTRYPEQVRALVLDGAVPPFSSDQEQTLSQMAAIEAVFDRYDRGCDRDPDCPVRSEGLRAAVERQVAALEADPIPLGDGEFFGPNDLLEFAITMTYIDPTFYGPLFAEGVADLDQRDASNLNSLNNLFAGGGEDAAFWSVLCADGQFTISDEEMEALYAEVLEVAPLFGRIPGNLFCRDFPGGVTPLPELDTTGTPPLLVIGNTGDNATPYADAVRLDQLLADSVLVTYEGPGHTVTFTDDCIDALVSDYLVDLVLPTEGTTCVQPPSDSPWYEPIPAD